MDFYAILDQVIALLRQRQRVTYRALKVQFQLEDDALEALKEELIEAQHLAADEAGRILIWVGDAGTTAPASSPSAATQERAPLTYTPPYLAEKILTSRSALEGERKHVTVLFADLKGSMALLADRDPEEARQLLDPVLERMMAAVHRYEGTVNQVMGDGIMALFGAPIAHEDHAVRACYAALAMQASVQQYAAEVQRAQGVPVQIRVGLNSGEVVVRAIGSDLHMDYTAVGQITHLAARMEQMAMPGSIVITPAVLGLAEGYVQVKPLGPVAVKGLSAPLEVYEVLGAGPVRTRLQAAAARGLTRFVGRDTELEAVRQAFERARTGRGQVVALVGEPGVGKSRLVYECTRSHRTQGWRLLESHSVSYSKTTGYLPVIALLKAYGQIDDRDDPRSVRAKVTGQVLTLDEALQDTIPALLALLEALPADSPFRSLDPPQRRQRTLEALKRLLLRESQEQPLLAGLRGLALDRRRDPGPAGQPGGEPADGPSAAAGQLSPGVPARLGRQDVLHAGAPRSPAAAERRGPACRPLLGDDAELQPLTPRLIAQTQGNPFFLEESVRTLVETEMLVGERGAYRLAQALPAIQVPATVQAVLAARIDRLPPEEKRLLQTAAVHRHGGALRGLLQAIAEMPEEALRLGLTHLQAAEFVYETRLFPELEYTFKHALTHEVAYGSLLLERRRVLHARIVEALEALEPSAWPNRSNGWRTMPCGGRCGTRPWRTAGRRERRPWRGRPTARPWDISSRRSVPSRICQNSATPASRPSTSDSPCARRSVPSGDLGRILVVLREAEALAAALDDARRLGQISAICQTIPTSWARLTRPSPLPIAPWHSPRPAGMLSCTGWRTTPSAEPTGPEATIVRRSTASGRPWRPSTGRGAASASARLNCPPCSPVPTSPGAMPRWARSPRAGPSGKKGSRLPRRLLTLGASYGPITGSALLSLRQGDLPRALPLLARAVGISQDTDSPGLVPHADAALGAAYTLSGRIVDAMPLLTRAMEQVNAMEMGGFQALCSLPLGDAQLLAGRLEEAHALAERALALARTHQERGNQAYALRLLGEIAAQRDPPESARPKTHYRQALTLAEELGMRPLQAHCHRGLGMLYATTGQRSRPAPSSRRPWRCIGPWR